MPYPRIDVPDIPFHVYSRGNNKQRIYFDERDRLTFLKILRESVEKFPFVLFSYALMDNHFHLLIKMLRTARLGRLMHRVQMLYARYFNRKYARVGHLYQSRYYGLPVQTDRYFLTVDRYIHLNPVRAGMVQKPEDFAWSSYRDRFSKSPCEWIAHGDVLGYFGPPGAERSAYKKFTEEAIGTPEEWSDSVLRKMEYHGTPEFGHQVKNKPLKILVPA
jgi:putative transposase